MKPGARQGRGRLAVLLRLIGRDRVLQASWLAFLMLVSGLTEGFGLLLLVPMLGALGAGGRRAG